MQEEEVSAATALAHWAAVANSLCPKLPKQTLEYQASVISLHSASRCMHMPEAREFLDEYVRRMLSIILNQNPANLGFTEKNCINQSIQHAMKALMQLDPVELFEKHFKSLSCLFDENQTYYSGMRSNWNGFTSEGCLEERTRAVEIFCDNKGIEKLTTYCVSKPGPCPLWAEGNSMHLNKILKSIAVVDGYIDEKEGFVKEVLRGLGELTEVEMKAADYVDLLIDILESLKEICKCGVDISQPQFKLAQIFHPFWQDFTVKLISSGSILLKLMAWDQMNELIIEAHKSTPRAESYIISGAGLPWVDGTYTFSKYDLVDQSVQYTYTPTGKPENDVKLLTLSRCKMQTGAKWWYISYADEKSPGTDKDIDYYQKTVEKDKTGDVDLEMTGPPLDAWVVASRRANHECRHDGRRLSRLQTEVIYSTRITDPGSVWTINAPGGCEPLLQNAVLPC